MRTAFLLVVIAVAGCNVLPPALAPPLPATPAGDSVLIFGVEVPATPEAVRDAVALRIPASASYAEVTDELNAEGFAFGSKVRRDGRWSYTVSSPMLVTSRWGMVQDVRIRFTERAGVDEVTLGEVRRLPESEILEACPDLRRLPGMNREEAESLFRANGFTVRATTTGWGKRYTVLHARRWGDPSPHSPCAMLACRVEDGRIATVIPATGTHPARGFDELVGMFPNRAAPAASQARTYAMIPVWTTELFGLGLLQWMFVPFAL